MPAIFDPLGPEALIFVGDCALRSVPFPHAVNNWSQTCSPLVRRSRCIAENLTAPAWLLDVGLTMKPGRISTSRSWRMRYCGSWRCDPVASATRHADWRISERILSALDGEGTLFGIVVMKPRWRWRRIDWLVLGHDFDHCTDALAIWRNFWPRRVPPIDGLIADFGVVASAGSPRASFSFQNAGPSTCTNGHLAGNGAELLQANRRAQRSLTSCGSTAKSVTAVVSRERSSSKRWATES